MSLLFAYGDLARGGPDHDLLCGGGSGHIGPATSECGIAGELYSVDHMMLCSLDDAMSAPPTHRREKAMVTANGRQRRAWMYMPESTGRDVERGADPAHVAPEGWVV